MVASMSRRSRRSTTSRTKYTKCSAGNHSVGDGGSKYVCRGVHGRYGFPATQSLDHERTDDVDLFRPKGRPRRAAATPDRTIVLEPAAVGRAGVAGRAPAIRYALLARIIHGPTEYDPDSLWYQAGGSASSRRSEFGMALCGTTEHETLIRRAQGHTSWHLFVAGGEFPDSSLVVSTSRASLGSARRTTDCCRAAVAPEHA